MFLVLAVFLSSFFFTFNSFLYLVILTVKEWNSERTFLGLWLLAGFSWWSVFLTKGVFSDKVPCLLRADWIHWAFGFNLLPILLLTLLRRFAPKQPKKICMRLLSFLINCLLMAYGGLIVVDYGLYASLAPSIDGCMTESGRDGVALSYMGHSVICLTVFTLYFHQMRRNGVLSRDEGDDGVDVSLPATVPTQNDNDDDGDSYAQELLATAQYDTYWKQKQALKWGAWMALVGWCYVGTYMHVMVHVQPQWAVVMELWAMIVLVHGGFAAWVYRRLWSEFFVEDDPTDEKDFGLLNCIVR